MEMNSSRDLFDEDEPCSSALGEVILAEFDTARRELIGSSYWGSSHETHGLFHAFTNGGVVHLLVPRSRRADLPEMTRGVSCAVISHGPWPAAGYRHAVEVMFEDGSTSPYALHLSANSFTVFPRPERNLRLKIWVAVGAAVEFAADLPCACRKVPLIPWMRPL